MDFEKLLYFILAVLVVATFVVPFVSAAPPFLTSSTTSSGLLITAITPETIMAGNNYTFYWYVQNQTTGAFLNSSGMSCTMELYQEGYTGLHTADIIGAFDGVEEFSAFVNNKNFTTLGEYTQRVKCNSTMITGVGGISDKTFFVTNSGQAEKSSTPSILAIFFVIAILITLAVLFSKNHQYLSLLFTGISLYFSILLVQAAESFVEAVPSMFNPLQSVVQIMSYVIMMFSIYMVIYIFIRIFEAKMDLKKMKLEGIDT